MIIIPKYFNYLSHLMPSAKQSDQLSNNIAISVSCVNTSIPIPTQRMHWMVEEGVLPTPTPLGLKLNPTPGTLIARTSGAQ